jgi:hypothetical protein
MFKKAVVLLLIAVLVLSQNLVSESRPLMGGYQTVDSNSIDRLEEISSIEAFARD